MATALLTKPINRFPTTGLWVGLKPLDRESVQVWLRWARSSRGRRKLRAWAANDCRLAGWDSAEMIEPVGGERTDQMQAALVALAQAGDGDASITLVTQMRPGLLRVARSLFSRCHSAFGTLSEVVIETQANFFQVLFDHSLECRPHKIAANLILDTRQRMYRARQREMKLPTVSANKWDRSDQLSASPDINNHDVADLLSSAIQSLPGTTESHKLTAELAYRVWILGDSQAQVAQELDLSERLVTTRIYRLRMAMRTSLSSI